MKKHKKICLLAVLSGFVPLSTIFISNSVNTQNNNVNKETNITKKITVNYWNDEELKENSPFVDKEGKPLQWDVVFNFIESKGLKRNQSITLYSTTGFKDNLNLDIKLEHYKNNKSLKQVWDDYFKNLQLNTFFDKNKLNLKNDVEYNFDFEIKDDKYINIILKEFNSSNNQYKKYYLIKNQLINWNWPSDFKNLSWKERIYFDAGFNYKTENGKIVFNKTNLKITNDSTQNIEYIPDNIYIASPDDLNETFVISFNGSTISGLNTIQAGNGILHFDLAATKNNKNNKNEGLELKIKYKSKSNSSEETITFKSNNSSKYTDINLSFPGWDKNSDLAKKLTSPKILDKEGNETDEVNKNYDSLVNIETGLKSELVWVDLKNIYPELDITTFYHPLWDKLKREDIKFDQDYIKKKINMLFELLFCNTPTPYSDKSSLHTPGIDSVWEYIIKKGFENKKAFENFLPLYNNFYNSLFSNGTKVDKYLSDNSFNIHWNSDDYLRKFQYIYLKIEELKKLLKNLFNNLDEKSKHGDMYSFLSSCFRHEYKPFFISISGSSQGVYVSFDSYDYSEFLHELLHELSKYILYYYYYRIVDFEYYDNKKFFEDSLGLHPELYKEMEKEGGPLYHIFFLKEFINFGIKSFEMEDYKKVKKFWDKNMKDFQDKNKEILKANHEVWKKIGWWKTELPVFTFKNSLIDTTNESNISIHMQKTEKWIQKTFKNLTYIDNQLTPISGFPAEFIKTSAIKVNANTIVVKAKYDNGKLSADADFTKGFSKTDFEIRENGFYLLYDISKSNLSKFKLVWIDNKFEIEANKGRLSEIEGLPSFVHKFWGSNNFEISEEFKKYLIKVGVINTSNFKEEDLLNSNKYTYDKLFPLYQDFLFYRYKFATFNINIKLDILKLKNDFKPDKNKSANEKLLNHLEASNFDEQDFLNKYVKATSKIDKNDLKIKNKWKSDNGSIYIYIDHKDKNYNLNNKVFRIDLSKIALLLEFNDDVETINNNKTKTINEFEDIIKPLTVDKYVKSLKNSETGEDIKDINKIIKYRYIIDTHKKLKINISMLNNEYYISNFSEKEYDVDLGAFDEAYLSDFEPPVINLYGRNTIDLIKNYLKNTSEYGVLQSYLNEYNRKKLSENNKLFSNKKTKWKNIMMSDIIIEYDQDELIKVLEPRKDSKYWEDDKNKAKLKFKIKGRKISDGIYIKLINDAPPGKFKWPDVKKIEISVDTTDMDKNFEKIKKEAKEQITYKIKEAFGPNSKLVQNNLYDFLWTDEFFKNLEYKIGTNLILKGLHYTLQDDNGVDFQIVVKNLKATKPYDLNKLEIDTVTTSEENKEKLIDSVYKIIEKNTLIPKEELKNKTELIVEDGNWNFFFIEAGTHTKNVKIIPKKGFNDFSGNKNFNLSNKYTEEMLKEALEIKSKNKKKLLSWLIPVIILSVVGIIATIIAIWYRKKKKRL
ncbi:hypothetical protein [Mycoplasmopsis fermentans]|uniref:hypothetical protein n=1 Tax=Mycoplasmopsis fermentans TaxID=2115 RepID=UPI0001E32E97|nr:hypothetical protein [Mycoplasmopsis fermentans]ADN69078.1 conserved hypothetical membrane spanning protein [Mycoplasmopsis fermentans JER]